MATVIATAEAASEGSEGVTGDREEEVGTL